MSADNRLIIFHFPRYGNQQWAVWHGSGSCEYCEPSYGANYFDTEKEAYDFARKEAEDTYLEYGIQILTKEEQMRALAYQIKDCAQRLDNLMQNGVQLKDPNEGRDD